MYIKKYNPNNLLLDNIDKFVKRVKILIIDSNNKVLICNTDGKYAYVGGHVEKDESLTGAFYRELKEETGINITKQNIEPFYKIERWNVNHYNTGLNYLSEIYYYSLNIDEPVDYSNLNLDETEINKNFYLEYIDIENFHDYIKYLKEQTKKEIYDEMLEVFDYYTKNIYGKSNEKKLQKRI